MWEASIKYKKKTLIWIINLYINLKRAHNLRHTYTLYKVYIFYMPKFIEIYTQFSIGFVMNLIGIKYFIKWHNLNYFMKKSINISKTKNYFEIKSNWHELVFIYKCLLYLLNGKFVLTFNTIYNTYFNYTQLVIYLYININVIRLYSKI